MDRLQVERSIIWNRTMSVAEFVVDDSAEAINAELMERGLDPDQIIAVFHESARLTSSDLDGASRFRVLYRA